MSDTRTQSPDATLIDLCEEMIAIKRDNNGPWPDGDANDMRGDDWHNTNLNLMDQLADSICNLPTKTPAGLVARARCLLAAGDALGEDDEAQLIERLLRDTVALLTTDDRPLAG